MHGKPSFSVQGTYQLCKQKLSTVFLCFPFVECTLRRISYRPRRRKLPSVCWQLPGRFRYPRSIYAVASYTATRVIYGTTGLAFSLRDHILPPGRPLARKYHYPQVRCHGLRSNAVFCFVRLQVDRSPLSEVLAPWPGGFSFRPG